MPKRFTTYKKKQKRRSKKRSKKRSRRKSKFGSIYKKGPITITVKPGDSCYPKTESEFYALTNTIGFMKDSISVNGKLIKPGDPGYPKTLEGFKVMLGSIQKHDLKKKPLVPSLVQYVNNRFKQDGNKYATKEQIIKYSLQYISLINKKAKNMTLREFINELLLGGPKIFPDDDEELNGEGINTFVVKPKDTIYMYLKIFGCNDETYISEVRKVYTPKEITDKKIRSIYNSACVKK